MKICVFCGSRPGNSPVYKEEALRFADFIVENDATLVYGAGSEGMMGELATRVMKKGAKVIGIIPEVICGIEVPHNEISELIRVNSMHERKQAMYDKADMFVALPGGIGTLDELCEIITWGLIDLHQKPIYIVNTNGIYNNLIQHFKTMEDEGFFYGKGSELFKVIEDGEEYGKYIKL